jgi:hypothetical protein
MSDREESRPSAEQTNWAMWPMRQPHSNTKPRGRYPNPPHAARVAMAMAKAKAQGGGGTGAAPAVGGAVF